MALNTSDTLAYGERTRVADNIAAAPRAVSIAVEREFAATERDWRGFEVHTAGHVFQAYEWVSNWHKLVGHRRGIEPRIVIGRAADGRVLFLLPFGIEGKYGVKTLHWLGGRQADLKCGLFDTNFLLRTSDADWNILWKDILAALPPVDVIHLSDQPERLGMYGNPFVHGRSLRPPGRARSTILSGDWQSYYAAKCSGPARREDRRRTRRRESEGQLRFEVVRDPAAAAAVLEQLFIEKAKLLARLDVRNPFRDCNVRAFYAALAKRMYPEGLAHLSTLTLDGTPIAIHWGAVFNRRLYYLLTANDTTRHISSPRTRQLRELLRWCIEAGVMRFDFGAGEQAYKSEWCEDHMALFATVEGRTLKGRAAATILELRTRLKHRTKTSKRLWPLAQVIRIRLCHRLGAGA